MIRRILYSIRSSRDAATHCLAARRRTGKDTRGWEGTSKKRSGARSSSIQKFPFVCKTDAGGERESDKNMLFACKSLPSPPPPHCYYYCCARDIRSRMRCRRMDPLEQGNTEIAAEATRAVIFSPSLRACSSRLITHCWKFRHHPSCAATLGRHSHTLCAAAAAAVTAAVEEREEYDWLLVIAYALEVLSLRRRRRHSPDVAVASFLAALLCRGSGDVVVFVASRRRRSRDWQRDVCVCGGGSSSKAPPPLPLLSLLLSANGAG